MREIPLDNGMVARVSDEDYERVMAFPHKWAAALYHRRWYAYAHWKEDGKWRSVFLHRFIMNVTDPKVIIDHVDHDGLHDERENLREANPSQNAANMERPLNAQRKRLRGSSKYRGVSLENGKWRAAIRVNYKKIDLGRFKTEVEAAKAYNAAAWKYFGIFANPNEIPEVTNVGPS